MAHRYTTLSTDAAIRKYLDSRQNSNEPISLADAVRTIRIVDQRGVVSVYDPRYARPLRHMVGDASASSASVH